MAKSLDRHNYTYASEKFERLKKDRKLSVEAHEGFTAIICTEPINGTYSSDDEDKEAIIIRQEADCLIKELGERSLNPLVLWKPDNEEIDSVIADPQISSVITLGSGYLNQLITDDSDPEIRVVYDWYEASCATTHLKQGFFQQRQCGLFIDNSVGINIPLGWFVTTVVSNIYANVGKVVNPTKPLGLNAKQFTPVANERYTYEEIRKIYRKHSTKT